MDDTVRILVLGDAGTGKTRLVKAICGGVGSTGGIDSNTNSPSSFGYGGLGLQDAENGGHIRGSRAGCRTDVKASQTESSASPDPEPSRLFEPANGRACWLEFLEVSGSSKHERIRPLFMYPLDGLILVHDLSNRKSLSNLQKWVAEINNSETQRRSGAKPISISSSAKPLSFSTDSLLSSSSTALSSSALKSSSKNHLLSQSSSRDFPLYNPDDDDGMHKSHDTVLNFFENHSSETDTIPHLIIGTKKDVVEREKASRAWSSERQSQQLSRSPSSAFGSQTLLRVASFLGSDWDIQSTDGDAIATDGIELNAKSLESVHRYSENIDHFFRTVIDRKYASRRGSGWKRDVYA